MDRRLALLVLWVAFVVAAVGVGFGAAGLVGDPFADGVTDAAPAGVTTSEAGRTPTGRASSSGAAGSPSPSPSASATATGGPGRSVTRTITTRGGLASATCRSGAVRLNASPSVGWQIEDIRPGPRQNVRVRFARLGDEHSRVEVRAACSGGTPRFALGDDGDEGGGEGGGGGGEGGED